MSSIIIEMKDGTKHAFPSEAFTAGDAIELMHAIYGYSVPEFCVEAGGRAVRIRADEVTDVYEEGEEND